MNGIRLYWDWDTNLNENHVLLKLQASAHRFFLKNYEDDAPLRAFRNVVWLFRRKIFEPAFACVVLGDVVAHHREFFSSDLSENENFDRLLLATFAVIMEEFFKPQNAMRRLEYEAIDHDSINGKISFLVNTIRIYSNLKIMFYGHSRKSWLQYRTDILRKGGYIEDLSQYFGMAGLPDLVASREADKRHAYMSNLNVEGTRLWPMLPPEIRGKVANQLHHVLRRTPLDIGLDKRSYLRSVDMDPVPEEVFAFFESPAIFAPPSLDFEASKQAQYRRLLAERGVTAVPDFNAMTLAQAYTSGYFRELMQWRNQPLSNTVVLLREALKTYFKKDRGVINNDFLTCVRNAAWKKRDSHFFHDAVLTFFPAFVYESLMDQLFSEYGHVSFGGLNSRQQSISMDNLALKSMIEIVAVMIRMFLIHSLQKFVSARAGRQARPLFETLATDSARVVWASFEIHWADAIEESFKDYFLFDDGDLTHFEPERQYITNTEPEFLEFAQSPSLTDLVDENPMVSDTAADIDAYFDRLNLS